jgi:hypothetical protein
MQTVPQVEDTPQIYNFLYALSLQRTMGANFFSTASDTII